MAKTARTKEEIFANTREMLVMAENGLAQATSQDPKQRRAGLINLFTYGRSVTAAIQTIKHTDLEFKDWWKPYQAWMQADPLMKYFNQARVEVIHEGRLSVHSSTVIGGNEPVDIGAFIRELNKYAPPNTVGTFLGEGRTGGNGWEVRMPDGSTQKVYFSLPETFDVRSELHLTDPPAEHDGQPITDTSVANIGTLYVNTLKRMVTEFETRFKF